MQKLISLISIVFLISCSSTDQPVEVESAQEPAEVTDNLELFELYKADQDDRKGEIDWSIVGQNDSDREERVYELLDSNKVITANDYANAAMVFQHGMDSVASGMAVKMMRKNLELDPGADKWLYAAAVDRDKMYRDVPQIYGTQYRKTGEDSPWELYQIDTTVVSDEERIAHGVETLAEQKEKVNAMNRRQLSEMQAEGKSIVDIVAYCITTEPGLAEFNISEGGLNTFGYELMAEGKMNDALEIFKTNTTLYPNAFNTWDSYGECLLQMDQTEAAVEAYAKSLELNPSNKNAENVLGNLQVQ